ncbi:rhomboid family intramembrane serine protease [Halomicroarcula sp. GCM10025324]|uniref:rhomboid family intramembrane serine protease n=1 Tax=Haloarcula TaxID=2237 RepID=UPI0023E765DE|nr:rhomboid family intramembrane serine protease [Halomicroarcula sp. ZS-22-S1]
MRYQYIHWGIVDSLLGALRRLLTVENIVSELREHVVTTGLLAVFFLMVMIETVVAFGAGGAAYQYWFAATTELTPGLLSVIVSHSVVPGYRLHVVGNGVLLFVFGRVVEEQCSRARYVLLFVVFGYVTTIAQLGFLVVTGSNNPSVLGASGSITAFAAITAVWTGAGLYRDNVSDAEASILLLATALGFILWWLLELLIPEFGGPQTGSVSHTVGILLGVLYGVATVRDVLR